MRLAKQLYAYGCVYICVFSSSSGYCLRPSGIVAAVRATSFLFYEASGGPPRTRGFGIQI